MSDTAITGYRYTHASLNHSHEYLLPAVFRVLDELNFPAAERTLFELGCGNGSVANELMRRGWDVTGVDPSDEGIQQARAVYPKLIAVVDRFRYERAGKQMPIRINPFCLIRD
jgi:2-polyprenyl-3-methyl-5-hydroxy-6-metoxy-1,4-benzoquinol methylase